jgi:hypothetical protein
MLKSDLTDSGVELLLVSSGSVSGMVLGEDMEPSNRFLSSRSVPEVAANPEKNSDTSIKSTT